MLCKYIRTKLRALTFRESISINVPTQEDYNRGNDLCQRAQCKCVEIRLIVQMLGKEVHTATVDGK